MRDPAPTPRIGRELLRVRAVCACAVADVAEIAHLRESVDGEGSPFGRTGKGGRRDAVLRLLERCH
jgi:hypothetical protein